VLDWYLLGLDILRRATAGNYEGENSHERVELVVQKPCRRNYSCPVWPGVIDHISVEMSAEQAVVSIRHPAPTSSAQIGARYLWDYKVANCHVPGFPPPRRPITPGVPPWWDDVDPDPEDEAPPVITPSHPEVGGAVEPGLRDRDPSAHDEHEPPPADQWEQDVHPDDPSGHPHVPVDPHRRIHPHAGDPNLPPEYFEDEVPVPPQGV
jgi:hypothetical protein